MLTFTKYISKFVFDFVDRGLFVGRRSMLNERLKSKVLLASSDCNSHRQARYVYGKETRVKIHDRRPYAHLIHIQISNTFQTSQRTIS